KGRVQLSAVDRHARAINGESRVERAAVRRVYSPPGDPRVGQRFDSFEEAEAREEADGARVQRFATRLRAWELAPVDEQNLVPAARQERGRDRPGRPPADDQH